MLLLEKKYFAVEGKIPLIKFAGSQWQRVLKSDKMADAAILGKRKISGKFPNNATNNVKQISSNGVTSLKDISFLLKIISIIISVDYLFQIALSLHFQEYTLQYNIRE